MRERTAAPATAAASGASAAWRMRAVEILLRVLVVVVAVRSLPANFTYDAYGYGLAGGALGFHHLPYRDFLWEYPPGTVPVLVAMWLVGGASAGAVYLYGTAMAACEYTALELVRRAYPQNRREITLWWTAVAVPLGAFAYFRLDHLAVLPATLAFVALARPQGTGKRGPAAALVVGAAAKVWPAAMAVGLVAQRRWRELLHVVGGLVAVVAVWAAFSPDGFRDFLRFRQGSGVQIESLVGGIRLWAGDTPSFVSGSWVVGAGGWKWVDPLGTAVAGGLALALALRAGARRDRLPALLGATVIAVMLGSRLLSAQFLVWPLPFVAVFAARRGRRGQMVGGLWLAAAAMTVVLMANYDDLVFRPSGWAWLVVARNLVLAAALAILVKTAAE